MFPFVCIWYLCRFDIEERFGFDGRRFSGLEWVELLEQTDSGLLYCFSIESVY